jgi:hypothetical protein
MIRNPESTTGNPLHPHDDGNGPKRSGLPIDQEQNHQNHQDQSWWSRSSIWSKAAVGILVVLTAIYAGILLLQTYTSAPSAVPVSAPSQHGSSLSTAPDGLAAYADLLARFGHKVDRLYTQLPAGIGHTGATAETLVVASPSSWNESSSTAVRQFVIKGGTAILAGDFLDTSTIKELLGIPSSTSVATEQNPGSASLPSAQAVADTIQPSAPAISATGESYTRPEGTLDYGYFSPAQSVPQLKPLGSCASQSYLAVTASPFTVGVRKVESGTDSACFATPGSFSKMLVKGNSILGLWKRMGLGSLVLMASSSPFQNAMISKDDNAALAIDLAGRPHSTITFDEVVHPITPIKQTGIGAIPLHWKVALVLGLLAALAALWSVGKRLGPVSPPERALAPARSGYIDAMATGLSKLHYTSDAVTLLQEEGKARLRRKLSIPADTGDSGIFVTARQAGVPDYVLEGLYAGTDGRKALIAAGRALAWTASTDIMSQNGRKDRDERDS